MEAKAKSLSPHRRNMERTVVLSFERDKLSSFRRSLYINHCSFIFRGDTHDVAPSPLCSKCPFICYKSLPLGLSEVKVGPRVKLHFECVEGD